MAAPIRCLSGHTINDREFWLQLRWWDVFLFPHVPAWEYWLAQPLTLDSPINRLGERFLSKASINLVTGCYVWRRGLHHNGYGLFSYDGMSKVAHRFSYREMVRAVEDGEVLDHEYCQLRYCVNWRHLDPVSHPENVVRGFEQRAGKGLFRPFQSRLWRPDEFPVESEC